MTGPTEFRAGTGGGVDKAEMARVCGRSGSLRSNRFDCKLQSSQSHSMVLQCRRPHPMWTPLEPQAEHSSSSHLLREEGSDQYGVEINGRNGLTFHHHHVDVLLGKCNWQHHTCCAVGLSLQRHLARVPKKHLVQERIYHSASSHCKIGCCCCKWDT